MMRKFWSLEEENLIRKLIFTTSAKDMSNIFHVSYEKMIDKIHKMKLNCNKSRGIFWNDLEDEILREHFNYAPKNYLMTLLPNRTWNSILQRGIKFHKLSRLTKDRIFVNYKFFDEWNNINSYVVGFILADGHLIDKKESHSLQIEVAIKDIDILQKIKSALQFQGDLYITGNSAKLQCNNVNIVKQLKNKGVPSVNKSYVAKFPDNLPSIFQKPFIRGLIDGDGWSRIEKYDNVYNVGLCGTYELVSEVKKLLPVNCENNQIRQQGKNCWRFNIKGKKALQIASWLYDDAEIYLERKRNAYFEFLNFLRRNRNVARTQLENQ